MQSACASAGDGPRATMAHMASPATKRKLRPGSIPSGPGRGKYPITDQKSVKSAASLLHKGKGVSRAAIVAHVRSEAKRRGLKLTPAFKSRADLATVTEELGRRGITIDLVGPKGYSHGWVRVGADVGTGHTWHETGDPVTTKRDYAHHILDEAGGYQESNADTDAGDAFELLEPTDEHGNPQDYEDFADEWDSASTRERLWDYGMGDPGLDHFQHTIADHLNAGRDDEAHKAAQIAKFSLISDGYADEEDFQPDPGAKVEVKKRKHTADMATAVRAELADRGFTIDLVGPKGYRHGWIYVGGPGLPGRRGSKSRGGSSSGGRVKDNGRKAPRLSNIGKDKSHAELLAAHADYTGQPEDYKRAAKAHRRLEKGWRREEGGDYHAVGHEAQARTNEMRARDAKRAVQKEIARRQPPKAADRPAVIMNQGPPKNPQTVPRNLATGKQAEHQVGKDATAVSADAREESRRARKAGTAGAHERAAEANHQAAIAARKSGATGTQDYHNTQAAIHQRAAMALSGPGHEGVTRQDRLALREQKRWIQAEIARRQKVDARPPGSASNYGPGNDLLSHQGRVQARSSNVGQVLDVGDHQWQKGSDGQWRHVYTSGYGGTEGARAGKSGRRADASGVHATKQEAKRLDELWAAEQRRKLMGGGR